MKALVVGTGLMGRAVAYGLHKLGLEVYAQDINPENLEKLKEIIPVNTNEIKSLDYVIIPDNMDVVVSAIPFAMCDIIASKCIEKNVRYCDLGGNPFYSEAIQKMAKTSSVFTDLGLAPGYINILAEECYQKYPEVKSISMQVGGLPVKPTGTLKYNRTFHIHGLVTEYIGECDIIRDGKSAKVATLEETENVYHDYGFELEAFHTRGGIGKTLELMLNRGVKECSYKTLRYRGHANLLKFLRDECKTLEESLLNACPETKKDMICIRVVADRKTFKEFTIIHDEQWTAMQKATGFPTAVVASIMASGKMDGKPVLDYSDIPINEFNEKLSIFSIPPNHWE